MSGPDLGNNPSYGPLHYGPNEFPRGGSTREAADNGQLQLRLESLEAWVMSLTQALMRLEARMSYVTSEQRVDWRGRPIAVAQGETLRVEIQRLDWNASDVQDCQA